MKAFVKSGISLLYGEFIDANLEKEYHDRELHYLKEDLIPLVLIYSTLFLIFLIPDSIANSCKRIVMFIAVLRILFLILSILLCAFIHRMKNFNEISFYFFIYELMASLLFLLIYYNYKEPSYFIQSYGVFLIIAVIFTIPGRVAYMLLNSFILSTGFIIISINKFNALNSNDLYSTIVYIFIIVMILTSSKIRIKYYRRKQFLRSKELFIMSTTDSLTNLYNRTKFDMDLHNQINECENNNTFFSLAIFDFDNFKLINDTYGHLKGDEILRETAKLVKSEIRKKDELYRWGGEEFIILLPETEKKEAINLTERLKNIISNYKFLDVDKVTCSFGVVTYEEKDDIYSIIKRADDFLYMAKNSGKNKVIG